MMKPFYLRGKATLIELFTETKQESSIAELSKKYQMCTLTNTLKILLRCKLQFYTRDLLVAAFQEIMVYEASASELKEFLSQFDTYKIAERPYL